MTRLALFLVMAIVALAPLPLGANRPWAWNIAGVAVALALLCWSLAALFGHRLGPARIDRWTAIAFGLFAAVGVWIAAQSFIAVPADWQAPPWAALRQAAGVDGANTIGADRDGWRDASVKLAINAAILFLAWEMGRKRAWARAMLWAVCLSAAGYVAFGMIEQFAGLRSLGFWPKIHYRYDVTGTFVNRNNFATYLVIALFAAGALAIGTLRRAGWPGQGLSTTAAGLRVGQRLGLAVAAVIGFLLIAGVFLSHSRGGLMAMIAGIGGALALVLLAGGVRWRAAAVLLALGIGGLAAVNMLSGGGVWERFAQTALIDHERLAMARTALAMIEQRPMLGWGYGGFESVVASMRAPGAEPFEYFIDKAHNTYLELAAEIGIPAAAALVAAAALPGLACLIAAVRGRALAYALAGVAATLSVGAHALIDFSIQIPAVAIAFFTVMGACAGQCAPAAVAASAPARGRR